MIMRVVCTGEALLPPYPGVAEWCQAGVDLAERWLAARDPALGYLREWLLRGGPGRLRQIVPAPTSQARPDLPQGDHVPGPPPGPPPGAGCGHADRRWNFRTGGNCC